MKLAECDLYHGWEMLPNTLLRCAHWGAEAVVLAGAGGWVYEIGWSGIGGVGHVKLAGLPEAVGCFEEQERAMAVRHFN